ncbi:MAG: hypothetical protein ACFFED_15635 [Candidatus Thorarchaeota archaeon]
MSTEQSQVWEGAIPFVDVYQHVNPDTHAPASLRPGNPVGECRNN